MTDTTTTAEKLAAWELIEEHGLSVWQPGTGWACSGKRWYVCMPTLTAAVKGWAEAAGVPWKPPKVEPMWALDGAIRNQVYDSRVEAEKAAHRNGCRVVPCEVVIRETKGV